MSASRTKRLTFIDVARTYAIFLALLAHAFAATNFFHQFGSDALLIKQFTRMATPLFVFMFGFMVEFVYVRRTVKVGISTIYNRIFARSFQCYFAYVLTGFFAVLGGYRSIEQFLNLMMFLANSRFGNILRVYSVILLITPVIIKLRLKFGIKFIYISLILLILSYTCIERFQLVDLGILNRPANIFFGIGLQKGGPSVYGALSFCLAGMFMASSLSKGIPGNVFKLPNFYYASFVLIITALILGYAFIQEDAAKAWVLFSNYTYRKNNASAYYIIGILGCVLTITLLFFLVGNKPLPKAIQYVLPLGTSSLISYTAGNIILILFAKLAHFLNLFVFIVLFFLSTLFITRYFSKIPYYDVLSNFMNFKYNPFKTTSRS